MNKKRYRARQEWNGIEIFDRKEGRSLQLNSKDSEILKDLFENSNSYELNEFPLPDIIVNETINCEPIIDSPYPKTSDYCSAPKRVYWELTRRCNLNCPNCYNRYVAIDNEMAEGEQRKLAEELYTSGVWITQLTGGEASLLPYIWRFAAYLKQMGFYVALCTNGVFEQQTLENALNSEVDWFTISIDEAHETQAGLHNFKGLAKRSISELAKYKKRIRVNTLIRRGNSTLSELRPLAEFCAINGVESLNCIPQRPYVLDKATLKNQLTPWEFKQFIDVFNKLFEEYPKLNFVTTLDLRPTDSHDRVYTKDKSCAAGREGCVISPYGDVYGCSYSKASARTKYTEETDIYTAGNIYKRSFADIWNDSSKWDIYRNLQKYKHPRCQSCNYYLSGRCIGNCPIMGEPSDFDPYCYIDLS